LVKTYFSNYESLHLNPNLTLSNESKHITT
jgi:hypothetical protein